MISRVLKNKGAIEFFKAAELLKKVCGLEIYNCWLIRIQ